MKASRRLSLLPTILLLLAALVGSPSLETHQSSGHLPDGGGAFETDALYLAGHSDADRSLHIESLHGIEPAHCVGCLLRQTRDGLIVSRQLSSNASLASASAASTDDVLPTEPSRFSGAPRGPPGPLSHSS